MEEDHLRKTTLTMRFLRSLSRDRHTGWHLCLSCRYYCQPLLYYDIGRQDTKIVGNVLVQIRHSDPSAEGESREHINSDHSLTPAFAGATVVSS